jgi:hypothetical protein
MKPSSTHPISIRSHCPANSARRCTLPEEETDALRGTNVYGATHDRRRVWEAEWEQCRADVSAINAEWADGFTWYVPLTTNTNVIPPPISSFVARIQLTYRKGALPDRLDVPVLARVPFDPPLALADPRPAARLAPRAHPGRRRAQPRAWPAGILGRLLLRTVATTTRRARGRKRRKWRA